MHRARVLTALLSLLLVAPTWAASRRRECRDACADAVVACAATASPYGNLIRPCRRVLVKRCLREGMSICATLATPTTTLPPARTPTTTTTTTSLAATTTTTTMIPPPVRERSAAIDVSVFGSDARLTVGVENGPQIEFTVDVVAGRRSVCLSQFHVVQGSQQLGVSATRNPETSCLASEAVCDTFVDGVRVTFTCTDFPAWFDPSAPFVVDWSGTDLELP